MANRGAEIGAGVVQAAAMNLALNFAYHEASKIDARHSSAEQEMGAPTTAKHHRHHHPTNVHALTSLDLPPSTGEYSWEMLNPAWVGGPISVLKEAETTPPPKDVLTTSVSGPAGDGDASAAPTTTAPPALVTLVQPFVSSSCWLTPTPGAHANCGRHCASGHYHSSDLHTVCVARTTVRTASFTGMTSVVLLPSGWTTQVRVTSSAGGDEAADMVAETKTDADTGEGEGPDTTVTLTADMATGTG